MESSPSRSNTHIRLQGLSVGNLTRVLWWRLRVTPTARLRLRQLRQGIRDGRGRDESLRIARTYRA